jgi:hypothetical protein
MATLLYLGNDLYTTVDDEDYYWLSQWNWNAVKIKDKLYVKRGVKKAKLKTNVKYELFLHRVVMKCTNSELVVDHIDKNPLNNQKSNLRICTKAENNRNTSSHKNSSSKYLGVSYDKARNKWQAQLMINGKKVLMKRYITEKEAAEAYDQAAKLHSGEYANLNFK